MHRPEDRPRAAAVACGLAASRDRMNGAEVAVRLTDCPIRRAIGIATRSFKRVDEKAGAI